MRTKAHVRANERKKIGWHKIKNFKCCRGNNFSFSTSTGYDSLVKYKKERSQKNLT